MFIAVNAVEHPVLDGWVTDLAEAEAARSGIKLGVYLGREDALPCQTPDLCCHLFGDPADLEEVVRRVIT